MQGQRVVGFCQDAHEVVFGERTKLNPDGQTTLEFWQKIGRFRDVERTRGHEQDVVGFDRPVLGRYGCAFDQWQEVALHAFAGHISAACVRFCADLVDLIKKHDSVRFNRGKGCFCNAFVVEQLVGLIRNQGFIAFSHSHLLFDGAATSHFAE